MNDLYRRIESLCENRGVSITQMCRDSGAPRGSLGDLSKNRIQKLSATTLAKIANYFNVSIDYLLGTENKKSPAPEGAELSGSRLELWNQTADMSEDEIIALTKMAETIKGMRGEGK